MSYSRRDFIKIMGVALAALATTRCAALEQIQRTISTWGNAGSERVRKCWLGLRMLYELEPEVLLSEDHGYSQRDQLISDHRAALNDLVNAEKLEKDVAEEMDTAFTAAAEHVWWLVARTYLYGVCYTPTPPGPTPIPDQAATILMSAYVRYSADQLFNQTSILADMSRNGEIDPATLSKADQAIQRDIQFINLAKNEAGFSVLEAAIYDMPLPGDAAWKLFRDLYGDNADPYVSFDFDNAPLDISPQAREAARLLTSLLTETN